MDYRVIVQALDSHIFCTKQAEVEEKISPILKCPKTKLDYVTHSRSFLVKEDGKMNLSPTINVHPSFAQWPGP